MVRNMFELMGTMLLLMLTGAYLRKKEFITIPGKKTLTDVLLYVILPANIVKAFEKEFTREMLESMMTVLVISVLIQLLCLLINKTLYFMMKDGEKQVYQYGTVCSNSGFMGNPLSQSVFGDVGLLYASVFLIPLRIVMWTAGVSYFTNDGDKKGLLKKVLLHPCMVAVYIGMFLMVTQLRLPSVLEKTVSYFSGCCTPMTMMYIGTILGDVDFRSLVSKKQCYFAFLRLIAIPAVVYILCRLAKVDALVTGVSVFLTAMPAGSTGPLLAYKYGADEESAAKSVVFTTALSIVTLTMWSILLTGAL